MTDQEILDNAPLPDWTHHNDDQDSDVSCFYSYIKQIEGVNGQEFYKLGFDGKRKVWKQCNGIYNTTRSRIDIKRIAELEKEKAIGVYHFTVEEYKAHNLEQQAKALQFALENITNPDLLYSRLKALKEQGK